MLAVRAAVVTALLASTLYFNIRSGLPGLSLTRVILYGLAAAVLILTVSYALWLRTHRKPLGLHIQIQVIFDVLTASLLSYITGGLESPFTFFYALPIIQTAVFFPRRGAMLTAGLACLLLGGLYVLESQGLMPVDLEGRVRSSLSTSKVVYLLAFNYAVFLAIAWLAGGLGEQLRRAGQELRETEEEVETLVALNRDIVLSLRSGLLALNPAHLVSLVNPVGEEILGCSAAEVLNEPGLEVFPELASLAPWKRAEQSEGREAATRHRLEVVHRRPDGTRVPVGLTLSPLSRADGEPAGTLVHMQDLTQFKAMEESMRRAERMAAVGGMAAVLAHEIRNPLASISGSVQVLRGAASVGDADLRLMDIILRETKRLDQLLSDFLRFTRPAEPKRQPTDLKKLVADTVEVFAQRPDAAGHRLVCDLQPIEGQVDPDQIRQVLWNLLSNAEQALATQGRIAVRLAREEDSQVGSQIWIEVADDGPGVAPQERERIFEPFVTSKEKGTGLGLATVHKIVEAHGGSIELACPDGGGSRFRVRLPGV
jgi:two-component system sensor histidine kinase PilS (NtrC family)